MARRLSVMATLMLATALAAALASPVRADPPKEPPYPLDSLPREAPEGDLACPEVTLETYWGDVLRYKPHVLIYTGMKPRLAAFERVVRDVAVEVYGRAPERIAHLGGYGCRRMREHAGWLSEHALGNAIDIEGFDFGHIAKGATLPAGLDKAFANGFEVRVLKHWGKKTGHAAVHARFLRTLALRLIAREDVFRVLLGPGYPGHNNHFHFDMSPTRLVQIFEEGHLLSAPPKAP
ncbi:Extensin-like protein [Minicystis rosea]|nr:Extensin-like protein [Minicystis rosea]